MSDGRGQRDTKTKENRRGGRKGVEGRRPWEMKRREEKNSRRDTERERIRGRNCNEEKGDAAMESKGERGADRVKVIVIQKRFR